MQQKTNARAGYFPRLDVVRSVACLVVIFSHLLGERLLQLFPAIPSWLDRVFRFVAVNGSGGVRIFFVLSGFLITHLMLKEIDERGRLDIRAFYIRRALRIWPLYAVVLLVGFVLVPLAARLVHAGDMTPGERFWPYALFLGNFEALALRQQGGNGSLVIGPTWSVAIEEQFYLVWPLIIAFVHPRRSTVVTTVVTTLVASAAFIVWRDDAKAMYFVTFTNLLPLAIGAFAAALLGTKPQQVTAWTQRVGLRGATIVSVIAGVCALPVFDGTSATAMFLTSATLSVPVALWCVLSVTGPGVDTVHNRGARALAWLGRYTYGLYLVHTTVDLFARTIGRRLGVPDTAVWHVLSGVVEACIAVGLAVASYHLLERPFLKLKDRFTVVGVSSAAR